MVPSPYTERDAREYVAASASGWRDGKNRNFAIVDAERRRVLGAVGFSFSAHDPGRATVGYWLAREARGRGAATRALRLAVRWAFAARRVERVELMAEPENEPSCRVAERSGFAREGVLRRYLPTRRGRRDVVIFSLLRDELRD
jgi:RimJ/RimL family protein N-acetyltransferase